MRRNLLTLLGAVVISLSALSSGCAAFEDSLAQGCFEQADCPLDSYCDDGVCLLRGEGKRAVIVESLRAVASDTPTQLAEPNPVTLSTLVPTRLTLQSGIEFTARLVTPDETLPSGRVEIERVNQNSDERLPEQAPSDFGVYVNEGVFKFRALPGTYSFTFSPDAVDGIGRPTFTYQNLVLTGDNPTLQFSYPSASNFREVSGTLTLSGVPRDYFENATIQFSSRTANLALQSAAAAIRSDGSFSVTLPPNPSGQWSVDIPSDTSGRLGFSTTVQHPTNEAALDPISIEIPEFQRVRLRVTDSLSDAYINARYEVFTTSVSAQGTLKQRLKAKNDTNPSSWVEVNLIPAAYSVRVTPEDTPLYLEQEFPLCVAQDNEQVGCVTPEQSDSLFTLARGYIFQGIIKDVAGLAVPNVPVTVRDEEGNLVTESLSDARGQFSVTVNMGQRIRKTFLFTFQPDPSTEIPWHHVSQEVDINNDATGIFSLPLGFAMSGLVIDDEQRPQTNTILRIFDVESLKLIAIASAGSEGYFTVFLADDGEQ